MSHVPKSWPRSGCSRELCPGLQRPWNAPSVSGRIFWVMADAPALLYQLWRKFYFPGVTETFNLNLPSSCLSAPWAARWWGNISLIPRPTVGIIYILLILALLNNYAALEEATIFSLVLINYFALYQHSISSSRYLLLCILSTVKWENIGFFKSIFHFYVTHQLGSWHNFIIPKFYCSLWEQELVRQWALLRKIMGHSNHLHLFDSEIICPRELAKGSRFPCWPTKLFCGQWTAVWKSHFFFSKVGMIGIVLLTKNGSLVTGWNIFFYLQINFETTK